MPSSDHTPAHCGVIPRRTFIKLAAGASVALAATPQAFADEKKEGMLYRTLGKTGEKVSAIGLGGFHIGEPKEEEEGIRIIRSAIDRGITFMDNCWDYHEGRSEMRMGKALRDGYRDRVFLMTKLDGRTKALAARQIDESLQRLQTDRIDLMQIHEVIRMDDPDRVFQAGGGIEALLEARKAGKIRFIGFTGHKDPSIHLHMLDLADKHQFHFDTVQMPLNVMDAHFRSFEKQVVPQAARRGIAVLGMKPLGSGIILKSGKVKPAECLHYALNLPTSVVITGIDKMEFLDQAIDAVKTFRPLSSDAVSSLLARTSDVAQDGKFELFKTSDRFDATSRNPQWLG